MLEIVKNVYRLVVINYATPREPRIRNNTFAAIHDRLRTDF